MDLALLQLERLIGVASTCYFRKMLREQKLISGGEGGWMRRLAVHCTQRVHVDHGRPLP